MLLGIQDFNCITTAGSLAAILKWAAGAPLSCEVVPRGKGRRGSLSKEVKTGKLVKSEFPDSSTLYLSSELTKADQKICSPENFGTGVGSLLPQGLAMAGVCAGATFGNLLLGWAMGWVLQGFRKYPPQSA